MVLSLSSARKALLTSRSVPAFKKTEYGSSSYWNLSKLALLEVLAFENRSLLVSVS